MATPAEMVTKIDTAIEAKLDGGAVDQYSIDGRQLRHMSLLDLYSLREKYARLSANASGPGVNYAEFVD